MRPILLVLALLLPALAGCAGKDDAPAQVAFGDVHGLAVHPEGHVFVATHHGLVRSEGEGWVRVGETQDDLMGFAMHPDGSVAWSSGHPKDRSQGANLGVRVSRDGGATWSALALPGVDFHQLAVSPADPERLWGIARGQLLRSDDAGATWEMVNARAPPAYALAGHRKDADALFAATASGVLRSEDGGRTFQPLAALAAVGVTTSPQEGVLFVANEEGVHRSDDEGKTWRRLALEAPGVMHLAVDPREPQRVYAASYLGGVFRSEDGGATWTTLRQA